jgi:hypothetical protein
VQEEEEVSRPGCIFEARPATSEGREQKVAERVEASAAAQGRRSVSTVCSRGNEGRENQRTFSILLFRIPPHKLLLHSSCTFCFCSSVSLTSFSRDPSRRSVGESGVEAVVGEIDAEEVLLGRFTSVDGTYEDLVDEFEREGRHSAESRERNLSEKGDDSRGRARTLFPVSERHEQGREEVNGLVCVTVEGGEGG